MFEIFSSAIIERIADGALVLRSAPVRCLVWFLALAIIPLGAWYCCRKQFPPVLAFFALLIPSSCILPGMANERIEITRAEIVLDIGFWFWPEKKVISLEDLRMIEEHRRGIYSFVWIFHYRSRRPTELILSDMLTSNRAVVLDFFQNRGIQIKKVNRSYRNLIPRIGLFLLLVLVWKKNPRRKRAAQQEG